MNNDRAYTCRFTEQQHIHPKFAEKILACDEIIEDICLNIPRSLYLFFYFPVSYFYLYSLFLEIKGGVFIDIAILLRNYRGVS